MKGGCGSLHFDRLLRLADLKVGIGADGTGGVESDAFDFERTEAVLRYLDIVISGGQAKRIEIAGLIADQAFGEVGCGVGNDYLGARYDSAEESRTVPLMVPRSDWAKMAGVRAQSEKRKTGPVFEITSWLFSLLQPSY